MFSPSVVPFKQSTISHHAHEAETNPKKRDYRGIGWYVDDARKHAKAAMQSRLKLERALSSGSKILPVIYHT